MCELKSILVGAVVVCTTVPTASAGPIWPFPTDHSSRYLIIGRDRVGTNQDVAASNFELGANKAPVSATDNFLDNGSSGGPTLFGATQDIPGNAAPVLQGIGGHGNIAVTDPTGSFELQDVGVYADPGVGIRIAGNDVALNQASNSFFNDPNHFPNTFDMVTQTGFTVNPNDAVQSTRIDPPNNNGFNSGVTFGFDHSGLTSELNAARSAINALASTMTLNTGGDGELDSDTTITLLSGLSVIDISTDDNDFLLNNMNLVIDGPADAFAIFRLPDSVNMLISNSNVLIGNSGIGLNNVLFYTDQEENDSHFSFSNTILNGVSFWSLGPTGGDINISNAQGCTQLVADIVDMDNVRFARCHVAVPEPATLVLFGLGAMMFLRRRF